MALLGGGKKCGITIIRVASRLKVGIDLAFANDPFFCDWNCSCSDWSSLSLYSHQTVRSNLRQNDRKSGKDFIEEEMNMGIFDSLKRQAESSIKREASKAVRGAVNSAV